MTLWRRIVSIPLFALGGLAILLTAVSAVPSNEWWIRILDFPRSQLLVTLVACLVVSLFVLNLRRWPALAYLAVLGLASAWQAYRVWPYTPFAPVEVLAAASCPQESRVLLLTANVQVSNETSAPLLDMVARTNPDLVLLAETNGWWDEQLEPLRQSYPEHLSRPQEDGHGLHFFSQFPLKNPEIRFLLENYVPSIKTEVVLPSGHDFTFYGVHPVPPPLADTEKRDAELLLVAREVRHEQRAAIIAGDLNDVAWSRTTQLFQEISGALDPRIGRGPFATFNADWPILRWPLDYVFFEPSFLLVKMKVMDHIGSDHFPLLIELCHDARFAAAQSQKGPNPAQVNRASEIVKTGQEEATKP